MDKTPCVLDLFAANCLQHKYGISNYQPNRLQQPDYCRVKWTRPHVIWIFLPPTACNTNTESLIIRQIACSNLTLAELNGQDPMCSGSFAANRLKHKNCISNLPPTACNTNTVSEIFRHIAGSNLKYCSRYMKKALCVLDFFATNRLQHKYRISNLPPTACNTNTISVICRQPPATQIQYQ
jgi:hypothetical protein